MSNFNKQGFRQTKLAERKKTKEHVKQFYRIMNDMEVVSKQLDNSLEYTEENINDYVRPIYGRDLDGMEKMLILGKLHYRKQEVINNIEVKHGSQDNI